MMWLESPRKRRTLRRGGGEALFQLIAAFSELDFPKINIYATRSTYTFRYLHSSHLPGSIAAQP